jgi:hypothetical protein
VPAHTLADLLGLSKPDTLFSLATGAVADALIEPRPGSSAGRDGSGVRVEGIA